MDLSGHRVLDGGFATQLERRGFKLDGPLWSASAIEEHPEAVVAVHQDYLEAGADYISTAGYQASELGFAALGARDAGAAAGKALRRAVELARQAQGRYRTGSIERVSWVAASLGPYGAALHNGAEFHGEYGVSFGELVRFHEERIAALVDSSESAKAAHADILAFETVPSEEEAGAIVQALRGFSGVTAWVSFTCRDQERVAHGEPVSRCASLLDKSEQVRAVGINCTAPALIAGLLGKVKTGTGKPVVVYPNSGENWDHATRGWKGESRVEEFGRMAGEWFGAGAWMVGGCCRTGPEHIKAVRAAADEANKG